MMQAGVYSAVLHYLKAVEAAKTDDGTKVIAQMKKMPTDDPLFGKGTHPRRRPQDPPGLPGRSEEARRVEGAVGLLQDPRHDPGRPGLPADGGRRLHAGEVQRRPLQLRRMTEIFGVPTQALFGQLLIGLINGSFYALLSLGLAVIFGLLNIINFTHGAQYMMGAFVAYLLLPTSCGLGYWWALLIVPLIVGATGVVIERLMLAKLYKLDHLYGLLLTFGLALIIQGLFRNEYGSSGLPYPIPAELPGGQQPRLHVPAELPRLGDRRLAGGLPGHLVRHREAPSSAPTCARRPRTRRWCRPSASTCRA